jgi:hypothetical protein
MRIALLAVLGLAPAVAALADTAPPPEVKATVDAFKGNWTFDASVTAGTDKPAQFKMTFNCKAIAAGNAVACDAKAKTPKGPFEGTFVVAYDPYSKAVHFIGVTSNFEVHDHVCQWKAADLVCTPLKTGIGPAGEEITEDVSMHVEKATATFTSTSHHKGGATMVFEGKGKK